MRQAIIPTLSIMLLAGCSSAPERIVDFENQPVGHFSSQSVSMKEVQIDVRMALARKGWTINPGETPGYLSAKKTDGEASATIEVRYSLDRYTLRYKESSGLDFKSNCSSKASDGTPRIESKCIKPVYNEWIKELNAEFAGKLQY